MRLHLASVLYQQLPLAGAAVGAVIHARGAWSDARRPNRKRAVPYGMPVPRYREPAGWGETARDISGMAVLGAFLGACFAWAFARLVTVFVYLPWTLVRDGVDRQAWGAVAFGAACLAGVTSLACALAYRSYTSPPMPRRMIHPAADRVAESTADDV